MINVFEIDKRLFVSGLFWVAVDGIEGARREEVKRLADEQKFDLVVLRTGQSPQAGFASTGEGAKRDMLSAAAMIAKTIDIEGGHRNFLCATKIPSGQYLYVSQRDGQLPHDGDILGTEDEVQSRLLSDLALADWGKIYAPDHWGVNAAQERAFDDFLPKTKKGKNSIKRWWGLKPVHLDVWANLRPYVPVAIIALLIAGGVFGFTQYKNYKTAQDLRDFLVQQELLAQKKPPKLPHPWKSVARAQDFVAACASAQKRVKTFWPGNWELSSITCADGALTVVWARKKHGWINHLKAVLPDVNISLNGESANLTIPLTSFTSQDELVPTPNVRLQSLFATAQRYGVKLQITPVPPPAAAASGNTSPKPIPDWSEFNWVIQETLIHPAVLVTDFDGEGFRIHKIIELPGSPKTWTLEGIQYAQP